MRHKALRQAATPVVVYTDLWMIDDVGRLLPPWRAEFCRRSGMILGDALKLTLEAPISLMIRKKCFDTIGLHDETLRYAEDLDMGLRLAAEYPFM
jgi:GT2 family glycosyltransferase